MNEIEHLRLGKRIEEIARRVHDLELEEAPSDALFEYVEGLEQKVLELTKRLDELDAKYQEAINKRLDKIDARYDESIKQSISYALYENGLDHL